MKIAIGSLLLAGALMGKSNDWLIVPGSRVGPITAGATRADLIELFGATNVLDEEVTVTDVGPDRGSVIFKNRPFDSVTVVWSSGGKISMIVPCLVQWPDPKDCHWHTREGITAGTTLKKLESLNGRPFDLAGFGWDEGGTVLDWRGGRLAVLAAARGTVRIRLDIPHSAGPAERKNYEHLQGDRTMSSSYPEMQALDPRLKWIGLYFTDGRTERREKKR